MSELAWTIYALLGACGVAAGLWVLLIWAVAKED